MEYIRFLWLKISFAIGPNTFNKHSRHILGVQGFLNLIEKHECL